MRDPGFLDWYELLRRLREQDVDFVVIGGVAATLQGSPVATFDVDVCTPMTDANLAKIHQAFQDLHPRFRFRPDKLQVPDDPARLRGFKNLNLETDLGKIDLLGELPGIGTFDDLQGRTTLMDVGGFRCRVLDLDTLIAAKKAAGRDKDQSNIRHLEAIRKRDAQQGKLFDAPSAPGDSPK